MAKAPLTDAEKQVKNILRRAGGSTAMAVDHNVVFTLRERQILWDFWKSDRHQGNYTCQSCGKFGFAAGERYDLMICRECFLPDDPLPEKVKTDQPIKVQRGPQEPSKKR